MRKIILGFLILLGFTCGQASYAQNIEGQIIAAQYGTWQVKGLTPDSYSFAPTSCRVQGGASFFFAFTTGTPVLIVDSSPSLSETVTPSSVVNSNQDCSLSIAPVHSHQVPFYLTSATGGLQEALNANATIPATNMVLLTSAWYQAVGTTNVAAQIAAAKGNVQLNLEDVTTTPFNFYAWNVTDQRYELVPYGGGGAGALETIQGDVLGNNAANTGAVDQDVFVAASPTTGASTISPQTAVNDAVAHNGAVILAPGVGPNAPFTNSAGVKVENLANPGVTVRSVTEFGAQCNTRTPLVTFSQGSTTVNIAADFFFATDVGKILVATGTVSGVPTRFITRIVSIAGNGSSATVTTAFPFAQASLAAVPVGNDDTAGVQSAWNFAAAHANNLRSSTAISFPLGTCLTHAINFTGASMTSVDPLNAYWRGMPGEDVLYAGDTATGNAVPGYGVTWNPPTMVVDDSIDATQAWQDINETTTTQHAALDRPGGILTSSSSNPTAPGWFLGGGPNGSGAYVGISTLQSTAVICTANAIASPSVGSKIVFPYLSGGMVTTTVASSAGSCAGGFTARTLTAALNSGFVNSQVEWFAGTTPQTITAGISGSSCPATIAVANSILPSPAAESNVAPQGVVQIDNEQFAYTFRTNAGAPSTQQLSGVTCGYNGTTRAAHSSGATIFPLNPFHPAIPWPVTPTITGGSVTPSNARFYPAWAIGNAAFAFVNSNGNLGTVGSQAFANANIFNWNVAPSDGVSHHKTAAVYLQGLPYSTHFIGYNWTSDFGFIEAMPTINSGGAFAGSQPTGDGSTWLNGRINACHVADWISGGQSSVKDQNAYSDCYSDTTQSYIGAGTCQMFTQGWNDQGGGAMSIMGNLTTDNLYCEPESGSGYGTFPVFEYDVSKGVHTNMHMGGGGEFPLGGNNQTFVGGNFNNQAVFPVLNYGYNNGSEATQLLTFGAGTGNVYGTNSLLSWGPNAHFSGATSANNPLTSPNGANGLNNDREPWHGQSMDTFMYGNVRALFKNMEGGFVSSAEINSQFNYEANPFAIPWHFDAGLLPDGTPVGGSVGCNMSTDGGAVCFSFQFNQQGIAVGPGQRLVGGKYTFYIASKSTGAATSYSIKFGVCSLGDSGTFTIPVSSSYTIQKVSVNLSGISGCVGSAAIALDFLQSAPANDTISVAFMAFAPVAQEFTAETIDVTNLNLPGGTGASNGCSQSPVVGIQNGYTCPTPGWSAQITSAQAPGDTTITVSATAGLPTKGCFYLDAEIECYISVPDSTHLAGITRGQYATTAVTHNAYGFPGLISANVILGSPTSLPLVGVFGSSSLLAVNATSAPQNHAGGSVLAINSGNNELWVDNGGGIHQQNTGALSTLYGQLNVGTHALSPNISDTANVMQQNVPASAYTPQTLGGGHMGSLNVIQTTTLPAPTVQTNLSASTSTTSYVCSGTDFDGNLIPGSTATLVNTQATWSFPSGNTVYCPYVAGVNTYQVYRTAGGGSTGLLGTVNGPGASFNDFGGAATAGSPPASNGSNPHISVAGTGTPCVTLGAPGATATMCSGAGAPASTCGTQPTGSGSLWMRTDGGASTSLYSCAGTTWTAVTIP